MTQKEDRCKVYKFAPRKGPKLKTVKYISPEKKQLLKQREQSKRDRRIFYKGIGVLLIIVALFTAIALR
ncbi:MAG: hypothetical protein PHO01_02415 [Desulfotomaculaceae bacterium]|nr:hypothetical protein [Desulfotomaculaceae bacterium]